MAELKRVVRRNGKIVGVESGDPHAPDAEDLRPAAKELTDAQSVLQQAIAATGVTLPPGLEESRQGMSEAVETLASSWHTVPDDARYQFVGYVRSFAKGTARSARDLAKALLKAQEAEEALIKGEQSSE